MSAHISGFELTFQQKDRFMNKPTGLTTHTENLELKSDSPSPRELIQPASARRDATEGSLLVRKMSTPAQQPGLHQQTTFSTGSKAERMKNININVAADKFLLGTMGALAYKEGITLMPATPVRLGSCGVIADVDNAARFSPNISGHNSGTGLNYGCEELCSSQKKSRPNPRPSRPPLLPPCRVCGDRASGYHYGVNTCEACKGFFRRSICKTESYVCTGSGDCKTLAGKRTACSHCRFKRCIDVGMSKNAIKTGRYTHELRSKNILEVKRLQKQASDESPDRTSVESSSSDTNYTEYKNDLLRKSMLEATLGVLVTGQKMLYEFLDDYYNDDLIRERQLSVYTNYMTRKARLLMQTESLPTQPDRLNTDTQHIQAHSERPTTDTACLATQTECLPTDTNQLQTTRECPTTDTEYLTTKAGQHVAQNELCSSKTRDVDATTTSQTEFKSSQTEFTTRARNETEKDLHTDVSGSLANIENKDLSLCAKTFEDASAQEGSIEERGSDDEHRIKLQSHETVTDTGNNTTKKIDNSVIQSAESLRAEVMSKIINDLEQGVQGMLAFAKSLPGFSDLPSQDQVSLVKAARFDIWYIGHIRCFNVELRVGACEWQFHADELAQVWGNPMVDLAFTLSRVAQTLDLTKAETAALRAVCLTFPDRCMDLQNRQGVEQMHADMLDVFKYVSCKKHCDYNKWFPKVINFLVLLREFGVKFEAVSSKLTLDWDVLKDNPVLLSVFLS